jgi:hypothetical protein
VARFLITVATVRERQVQGLLPVSLDLRPRVGALKEQRQVMRYLAALFLSGVGLNRIQVNRTRFVTHVLGVFRWRRRQAVPDPHAGR